jgi:hypothetical protein
MHLCKALCKQIFHFVGSPAVAGRKLLILQCTVIMKIAVLKVCVTSGALYRYDTVTLHSGDLLENCKPVGVI